MIMGQTSLSLENFEKLSLFIEQHSGATDGLMPYFIRIATVGILSGLITFYISKEHHLSL